MATVHGSNTVVTVNGTDISVYTKGSEFDYSADSHDTTHYGDTGHEYSPGLTDGTFTMEGDYDTTAGTGPRAVLRALIGAAGVTVIRRPEGTGSGLPQDSFTGLCTQYVESNPVADYVKWRTSFKISGAVDGTAQA